MLMEKAKWFAVVFGEESFTGGTGSQQRFKSRYSIVGNTLSGESEATSTSHIEKWLSEEWPTIPDSFSPSQIFNADERALFWQMLPNKSLHLKSTACHGGKNRKVRVSILLAANMDGSCKLRPFVIGKSRSPRCFKNEKGLPVRYASNKKAWITHDFFVEWLQAWDAELEKSGRKVCILDNCSAHHVVCPLKQIPLKFLPPNPMEKLQRLDQGIVKAFKVGYRRRLVQRLLINLRLGIELKVDLLGAIQMLAGAWNDVKKSTIVNCFRKTDFVVAADDGCLDSEDDDSGCLDSEFRELSEFPGAIPGSVTARNFVSTDDGVQAVADRADAEIVADTWVTRTQT
nr:tigger transposable element-derived protein 6-like [Dermacentor andersoni]